MPLDPYFSAGKLTWLLEHDDAVRDARDARHAAPGHGRRVPVRAARRGLRTPIRRPRRARSSGAPRVGRRGCSRSSACPRDALPPIVDTSATSARSATRPGRASFRCARGAWTSRPRSPARAASSPGLTKATYGTGVFVLAHVGRRAPAAGRRAAPDRRVERRRRGGVGARRRRVHRGRAARVAEPRPRAWPPTRPRSRPPRPSVEDAPACACCPALAGIGAPWWRSDARGGDRRADRRARARATSRARRSRRSRGAWPTSSSWSVAARRVEALRVDGGLTRDDLLLQLQADATGVPVERGAVDATAAGAAALAAVGAGLWPSTRRSPSASRWASGSSRTRRRAGGGASTPSGARSWRRAAGLG